MDIWTGGFLHMTRMVTMVLFTLLLVVGCSSNEEKASKEIPDTKENTNQTEKKKKTTKETKQKSNYQKNKEDNENVNNEKDSKIPLPDRVQALRDQVKLGMSKNEIRSMFEEVYLLWEVGASGKNNKETWQYNFNESGLVKLDDFGKDIDALISGKVTVQLFIQWTSDGLQEGEEPEIEDYYMYWITDDTFYNMLVTHHGTQISSEQPLSSVKEKSDEDKWKDMKTFYPVPNQIQNFRKKLGTAFGKEGLKSKLGEPDFILEAGDELVMENVNEDHNSDWIYYFTEDGSEYQGTKEIQNIRATEKGRNLVQNGELETFLRVFFDNEKTKKAVNMIMFYRHDGELYYYQENIGHEEQPFNMPYEKYKEYIELRY